MNQPYRKDLSHLTWEEVYRRQEQRGFLVPGWFAALPLSPGDRVLDVGAGPGYVSLEAARRVGPAGMVYAIDRSADALAHLARLQEEQGLPHIRRIVADAISLPATGIEASKALVTMVLHHCDDPAALVANVARLLGPGGRALVAEFAPDGPCNEGPPRDHRVAPSMVRTWYEAAGFRVQMEERPSAEHYVLVAARE